jgi:hypothetical protein
MKICPTETISVRPIKINQNQRKTCVCISKTLLGFNFFAVKISTVRTAHFYLIPVKHHRFTVLLPFLLNFVSDLFFSSFYCTARSADVDFRFFPRLAPLAMPFCIHAAWTVRPIRNKKNRRT